MPDPASEFKNRQQSRLAPPTPGPDARFTRMPRPQQEGR